MWGVVKSHSEHENGLSPVWVRRWMVRWRLWAVAKSHWEHEKGFSPVCVRRCSVRLPL